MRKTTQFGGFIVMFESFHGYVSSAEQSNKEANAIDVQGEDLEDLVTY